MFSPTEVTTRRSGGAHRKKLSRFSTLITVKHGERNGGVTQRSPGKVVDRRVWGENEKMEWKLART
jgi:hypothetical protein